MSKKENAPLIGVILVAAVLIGGSMIFAGLQFAKQQGGVPSNIQQEIQKGIADYVKQQQEEYEKTQKEAARQFAVVKGDYRDNDASMGNAKAPIVMVEFSDYECPFCAKFFQESKPQLKSEYIDTDKVHLTFRDFPLSFHKNAKNAAMAAECAREQGSDKTYFSYHDVLFANQQDLSTSNLKELAAGLGLNRAKFESCLDDEKYLEEVNKDLTYGQQNGISGTPGFLVLMAKDESKMDQLKGMEFIDQRGQFVIQYIETEDGKQMGVRISGAHPFETFKAAIEVGLN